MKTLDLAQDLKVEYCVPLWIRDENVRANTARIKARIEAAKELRTEPIAVVCYGPSLNETWEKVRDFKYIISCSGAHKFLVDRGIVPSLHCEVDPRSHKVELIGQPQKETTYLIASACSPALFDHLQGFNVKLWHIFAGEEEPFRVLPPEEWAVTGGSSVGLRAMTLARFLGFTEQHIFGMDGSSGPTGKHAGAHPNQPKEDYVVEYEGVTYHTTPSMLTCARQTPHELDVMPDVRATFYGEGLVQSIMKTYKPNPPEKNPVIAFVKPATISAEYRDLNRRLHETSVAYGVGGGKHAGSVMKLMEKLGTHSVLDYGCGKGFLGKALAEKGIPIWEYDPAIPGKDESPRPADIVTCHDVLEHVEPGKILFVLSDLKRCVRKFGFFIIHTGPSGKTLADGRNAHVLQRDRQWWKGKLKKFFQVASITEKGPLLYVAVLPKAQAKAA